MSIPSDYRERVYAGVLGKIIGVYLGRPIEMWSNSAIEAELGEIDYYVDDRLKRPLVVTDDDISGTFVFLRALQDHAVGAGLSAEQIGQTWLDYLIEGKTILWWGGRYNSTEHTAYLNLRDGLSAPLSGAVATNGAIVAEQIGAQIFIDGWALVSPGDPERALALAKQAASVSHDGVAVHAAQLLAAMEALAFIESDLGRILDRAQKLIPADSAINRLVSDLRGWHAAEPDWRKTLAKIHQHYGYDRYPGICHMIPNHALIHLGLLYGEDDFQRALMITNTAGWDTDCNAGNVGCFLGIKNGLAGIDRGPDWRGPVADRLYLPCAAGGIAITDAAQEAVGIINLGHSLNQMPAWLPKDGARFHFEFPGAVQGFVADDRPDAAGIGSVANVAAHSLLGTRSLALRFQRLAVPRVARFHTATFIPPEALQLSGYQLLASPTLYPGHLVEAELVADPANGGQVTVSFVLEYYGADGKLLTQAGPSTALAAGQRARLQWTLPPESPFPIARIGFEIRSATRVDGAVHVDRLDWRGVPRFEFGRHTPHVGLACRAWTHNLSEFRAGGELDQRLRANIAPRSWFPQPGGITEGYLSVVSNEGWRMASLGGGEQWENYRFAATVNVVRADSWGLAVAHRGLLRYQAVEFSADGHVALVQYHFGRTVLASAKSDWECGRDYQVVCQLHGRELRVDVDGQQVLVGTGTQAETGGIALLARRGHATFRHIAISPNP
jgi:ADP-ribosylglycohydrolase